MGENRSEAARDPRIPDHCGWAARGLWNKAYDALLLDNAALREEVDALIVARDMLGRMWESAHARTTAAEVERTALIAVLRALCDAYAACNGEDHPAYTAAREMLATAEKKARHG